MICFFNFSFLIYSATAAVIAAAAAAVMASVIVAVAAPTAAAKENDENKNYPEAAIAVTIIEAHLNNLSPR